MLARSTPKVWKRLSPRGLSVTIQLFSLVAIFFEGYDQGVMGGVNASPDYVNQVGIGSDGIVTDVVHQGGIVSIYYLGAIVGCFVGGWLADRIGRINGIWWGAILACIGGALQTAIQSSDFILVARVVTGFGNGSVDRDRARVLLRGIREPSPRRILGLRFHRKCRTTPRTRPVTLNARVGAHIAIRPITSASPSPIGSPLAWRLSKAVPIISKAGPLSAGDSC